MDINFNSINREVERVIIRHESEILIDRLRRETEGLPDFARNAIAASHMAGFMADAKARLNYAGKKFRFAQK